MATGILSAQHLTRRFGDRLAVDDVSFDLVPGEVFALLGPNGAGKTTTLRLLAGLLAPSSGTVSLNGVPLGPDNASQLRKHIGFLPEAPGLWDRLTVRQNLLVYARLYQVTSPDRAVRDVLDLLDMSGRAHEQAARLSKGLKQRVALARSLLHDPSIVLLDEPTAGLDPESARSVRAIVLGLRNAGRAVLLSTHNLDEVERVADRVAVMRSRLVALDTPAALRARLFRPRVRVVLSEAAEPFGAGLRALGIDDAHIDGRAIHVNLDAGRVTTPVLVRHLVDRGASIESVVQDEPSLEDVYLRLLDECRA
jgi:ABC-2 type transport system ATP-binding protein